MEYTSIIKPPTSQQLKSGQLTRISEENIGEHITENREELIIVLEGIATIHDEGKVVKKQKNETYFISQNRKHNIFNNEKTNMTYIYVVSLFA